MAEIVVVANPLRDECFTVTREVWNILVRQGHSVTVAMPEGLEDHFAGLRGQECKPISKCAVGADLIICLGGDGTILHTAHFAARNNTPILGLNMGSKGFMTGLERNELGLLENLSLDDLVREKRLMLDVELERKGQPVVSSLALNDAVVIKGSVSKMINLCVTSDGCEVMRFAGDGVIVSTPTGSTAYSMSAGGPIVDCESANIILTPICAHTLHVQPRVLSDKREICIVFEPSGRDRSSYLTVDGGDAVELTADDVIRVRKSEYYTVLVRLNGASFFDKIDRKLNIKNETVPGTRT